MNVVDSFLSIIDQKNRDLNIFIEVFSSEAIERAKEIDEKIKLGKAGSLAGMVLSIKDNICYKDHSLTAASRILQNFKSLFTATVLERLLLEDAIVIGRVNCDEFAMGSANKNSYYGVTRNPIDRTKVVGGSSGGSAASVSAGMCHVSLGSDTGGSVRQPASFCGVVGFKPTYGAFSRHGLIAFASSFDQIGVLANSVDDISFVNEVVSGKDDYDTTCVLDKKKTNTTKSNTPHKKMVYFREVIEAEGLSPIIREKFMTKLDKLRSEGHTVENIDFPYLKYLAPCYYILSTAEASSNLSRFDGIHYGYRSESATNLEDLYIKSRTEGFGDEVKKRILLGTFVLSSSCYDDYYIKGQKVRALIKNYTNEIFDHYDCILSPVSPSTAFDIDRSNVSSTSDYLDDIFTVHANLAGIPAISVPLSEDEKGLPIGIQIMTDNFKDQELLSIAKIIESN
ncbi:aspartyl-tRNA amidotransferase subunit A [Ichthyobacterium seriolicida]|uniref:Glutamyl-tRNA(Gln) amidotransferase subunit A n=1 Tax=Ichthyobacterium seriolicida TaxID=242600 RepID=A0A1J1EBK9_9FLAO|nr:aspartyl-tRNA amidotransferase subunit A [Ichthyobacterium seriolicida]